MTSGLAKNMRRFMTGVVVALGGMLLATLAGTACVGYLDADAGAADAEDGGAVEASFDGPGSPDGQGPTGEDGSGVDAGCDYGCVVLRDEPLVYLRFEDDVAATEARDSSENQLHGSYPQAGASKGAPGIVPGTTAVQFTGVGPQGIRMPPSADFDGPRPKFSVELWLKPDRLDGMQFIVDHETFAPARGGWLVRTIDGRIGLELIKNDAHLGTAEAPVPLTVGQWQHVVLSYDDESATGLIWIDGKLVKTAPMPPGGVSLVPTGEWSIGKQNCTPCQDFNFAGALDELAVYGRLLDQNIVDQHYRAARP